MTFLKENYKHKKGKFPDFYELTLYDFRDFPENGHFEKFEIHEKF